MSSTGLWIVLIFLTILLTLIGIFYFGLLYSVIKTKVPYVPTFNSEIDLMGNCLNLKPGSSIVDLGCGDGKAIRFLKKRFNLRFADGFDINPVAINLGKIYNFFQGAKNVNLYVKDIKQVDLKDYDYVYMYLFPEFMEKIEDLVFGKIGKNTIIISNSFKFKNHTPFQIIKNEKGKSKIYLYKK